MTRHLRPLVGAATLISLAAFSGPAGAATAEQIESRVNTTLDRCYASVASCRGLADKAEGVLVFPEVTRAGVGIGGAYGTGALRVGGKTVGYYSTTAASIGLQLGAEKHSEVIVFLTESALNSFRRSSGWQIGGDATVTVIDAGATGDVDTLSQKAPVVAFVFGETGLMGSLSLEGARIAPYKPE